MTPRSPGCAVTGIVVCRPSASATARGTIHAVSFGGVPSAREAVDERAQGEHRRDAPGLGRGEVEHAARAQP